MVKHHTNSKIVACIPAYNEEATIGRVVLLSKMYVDEVIVCDDGSSDMTSEIARALGAVVIRHERNMGYGEALKTLFKVSLERRADVIVTLDADGQHDPSEIPRLLEPILRGEADIVVGSRLMSHEARKEVPPYRLFAIKFLSKLLRAKVRQDVSDCQSGFRAYSRRALEAVNPTRSDMGVSLEILAQAAKTGLRVKEIPVMIRYRGLKRTSKKSPLEHGSELLLTLVDLMTWDRPLLYLGSLGISSLILSLFFSLQLIQLFNKTRYFSTPLALLAIAFGLSGLLFLSNALIVYSIKRLFHQFSARLEMVRTTSVTEEGR